MLEEKKRKRAEENMRDLWSLKKNWKIYIFGEGIEINIDFQ